jgi:hypothetical protein
MIVGPVVGADFNYFKRCHDMFESVYEICVRFVRQLLLKSVFAKLVFCVRYYFLLDWLEILIAFNCWTFLSRLWIGPQKRIALLVFSFENIYFSVYIFVHLFAQTVNSN